MSYSNELDDHGYNDDHDEPSPPPPVVSSQQGTEDPHDSCVVKRCSTSTDMSAVGDHQKKDHGLRLPINLAEIDSEEEDDDSDSFISDSSRELDLRADSSLEENNNTQCRNTKVMSDTNKQGDDDDDDDDSSFIPYSQSCTEDPHGWPLVNNGTTSTDMAPVKGHLNEGCLRIPIDLTEIDREEEDDDDDADSFSSDSSREMDFKTDLPFDMDSDELVPFSIECSEDQDGNTL